VPHLEVKIGDKELLDVELKLPSFQIGEMKFPEFKIGEAISAEPRDLAG